MVMFSGVDNVQGALTTVASTVALLSSVFGSSVVELTLAVLEMIVPFETVSTTYVAIKKAVSPRARVAIVQVVFPVSPSFGLVQLKVGPSNCPKEWNFVLAGTSSENDTDAASLGP